MFVQANTVLKGTKPLSGFRTGYRDLISIILSHDFHQLIGVRVQLVVHLDSSLIGCVAS